MRTLACMGEGVCAMQGVGSEGYPKNVTPGGAVMSESVGSSVSMKHGFIDSYVGGADGYDSSCLVKKGALGENYVFDKKTQESLLGENFSFMIPLILPI